MKKISGGRNYIWTNGNRAYIYLDTVEKWTVIDKEDIFRVKDYKWYFSKGYVVGGAWDSKTKKQSLLRLHRLVMKAKKGQFIDHKKGNTFDNRKCMLRPCTNSQNMMNSGKRTTNISGYKGVCWLTGGRKWKAQIMINYTQISLGDFVYKKDAARAYNRAALEYHGEFARLNRI